METTINQRIKILIDELEKGNQRQFAHKIGSDPTTINLIVLEKQKDVKAGILANIIDSYPTVNVQYLVSGIGKPVEKFSVKILMEQIEEMNMEHQIIYKGFTEQINDFKKKVDSLLNELEEERNKRDELMKKYIDLADKLVKYKGNFEAIVIDLYPKEQVTHEVTLAV